MSKLAGQEIGTFIYYNFAQRAFNLMEMTYLHHREGLLDDAVFEARIRGFRFMFVSQPENLIPVWEQSRAFYTDEFCELMERRIIGTTRPAASLS